MEIAIHGLGIALAALLVWRVVQMKAREREQQRLWLLASATHWKTMLAVVVTPLIAIGAVVAAATTGLLRGEASFMFSVAWAGTCGVAGVLLIVDALLPGIAIGSLTLIESHAIELDAEGQVIRYALHPNGVRMNLISRGTGRQPALVQFQVNDGERAAYFWGQILSGDMHLVTDPQFVQARGPMIASSTIALCEKLAPYVTRA